MEKMWVCENNIYKTLISDIRTESLSHAYLFITEDVFAITNICRKIASEICGKGQSRQTICERIEKGIFSDVIELGLNQKIVVEDINALTDSVLVSPFECDEKIYILFNVDDMTEEASNKLLKTLEEPPHKVRFFLCAKNEFALLQTIKSRCQKLYLNVFDTDVVKVELLSAGTLENVANVVATQSEGNLTKALLLAKDKHYVDMFELVKKMFFCLSDTKEIESYCTEFGNYKAEFDAVLNILSGFAKDMLHFLYEETEYIANKQLLPEFELNKNNISKTALLKLLQKIIDLKRKNFYNVNVYELIDELVFYFVEVKIKCKE